MGQIILRFLLWMALLLAIIGSIKAAIRMLPEHSAANGGTDVTPAAPRLQSDDVPAQIGRFVDAVLEAARLFHVLLSHVCGLAGAVPEPLQPALGMLEIALILLIVMGLRYREWGE